MIGKTKFEWNGKRRNYRCYGEIVDDPELTKLCGNCGGPHGSHVCSALGNESWCWDKWREHYPLVKRERRPK